MYNSTELFIIVFIFVSFCLCYCALDGFFLIASFIVIGFAGFCVGDDSPIPWACNGTEAVACTFHSYIERHKLIIICF